MNQQKNATTNYELNKNISHTIQQVGTLKRLSLAVVVNHRQVAGEDGTLTGKPLSDEEKKQISELVKHVVGFKDERVYDFLGLQMDGVGIWIAFKVAIIMPLSGVYAWYLTRLMQRHRISEQQALLEAPSPPPKVPTAGMGNGRATSSVDRISAKTSEHEANLG